MKKTNQKIYAVTGRHRSGTSMMMRALDLSSNITAEHNVELDQKMKKLHADPENYHPNPNGYYLLDDEARLENIVGKLAKIQLRSWFKFDEGNYLVVFMERDETERQTSWQKAFGKPETPEFIELYEEAQKILFARKDATICHVNYADVISDPLATFERLVKLGWPINPRIAASSIDESLYRNRLDQE